MTQDEINEYKYKMEINKFIRQVMEGKKSSELEGVLYYQDQIIEIAKLVAEREREACAKIIDDSYDTTTPGEGIPEDWLLTLAEQIRARGKA